MPVNTNELRDLAARFIAYLSTDQHDLICEAASELDALRTERNLARGAAGAEEKASFSAFSYGVDAERMAALKIEAAPIEVTTDFLDGLNRLAAEIDDIGPKIVADVWLRQLLGHLIVKEQADIRRMLPYDPGG